MKTDNKEKVLLALYAEYLMDEPKFDAVNFNTMEMSLNAFNWALMKLQTEGLITGVHRIPVTAQSPDKLLALSRSHLMLSREGVEAADEMLGMKDKKSREKLYRVYEVIKDYALPLAALIAPALGL